MKTTGMVLGLVAVMCLVGVVCADTSDAFFRPAARGVVPYWTGCGYGPYYGPYCYPYGWACPPPCYPVKPKPAGMKQKAVSPKEKSVKPAEQKKGGATPASKEMKGKPAPEKMKK